MANIQLLGKKLNYKDVSGVDNLLKHLFADRKTVYIDDINFSSDGGYDSSWCLDFTLKMSRPQWMDTHFDRPTLISYIRTEKLNQWEAFRFDEVSGSVQPYTETATDLETFLNENYQEVIQKYLEEN